MVHTSTESELLLKKRVWIVKIKWHVRKCWTKARWSQFKAKRTFHIALYESDLDLLCWVCSIGESICCAFCFTRNGLPSKTVSEDICHLRLINLISSIWVNLTSHFLSDTQKLFYLQDTEIKMGTQSVAATSMHQATNFLKGHTLSLLHKSYAHCHSTICTSYAHCHSAICAASPLSAHIAEWQCA